MKRKMVAFLVVLASWIAVGWLVAHPRTVPVRILDSNGPVVQPIRSIPPCAMTLELHPHPKPGEGGSWLKCDTLALVRSGDRFGIVRRGIRPEGWTSYGSAPSKLGLVDLDTAWVSIVEVR